MSRSILLAALLFLVPSIVICSEDGNTSAATETTQNRFFALASKPFVMIKDGVVGTVDFAAKVPNVATNKLLTGTRFETKIQAINRGVVVLATLAALYALYNQFCAEEEENNDSLFVNDINEDDFE